MSRVEFVSTRVVKYVLETLYGFPFNNHHQTNGYATKRINQRYVNDLGKELDTHDVLVIKSPMGSGKTAMFLNVIQGYDRILIVSCRKSYSAYMCTVVPGLVNYKDIKGSISAEEHPRVIIQVQSLKRIRAIKTETTFAQWDLVYIDEPNGVFNEVISPVTDMKERKNLAKYLRTIVSNIPTVVITDAGLALWHLEAVNKHLLSGLSRRKKMCIINENSPKNHRVRVFDSLLVSCTSYSTVFCPQLKKTLGKEDAYMMEAEHFFATKYESAAKDLFVSLVDRAYKAHRDQHDGDIGAYLRHILVDLDENAVVLCNTKRQANLIGAFTKRVVGEDRVVVITADTPSETKSTFMADPWAGLKGKRVLVHTTCLSVGVDFNFPWATQTFVIIDAMSSKHMPCVADIYQGLGRNRRSTHINIFVYNRRQPLKKRNKGIEVDHMAMIKVGDTGVKDTPWRPAMQSEYQLHSDVMEDTLDATVFKAHKLERSLNRSPRLFFDVLLGLLDATSMADVQYRQPTWEPDYDFFAKDSHVEKALDACKKLFSKNISKYTTLTLQSFNDIFKGEIASEKHQVLQDIVATLDLFKGDFSTSFFVLRHLNKHLLKQWAIFFCKLQFLEPTGAVDMLKFDEEAAAVVDPDELMTKVKKRLYENNRTSTIRSFADFNSAVAHTHAILDERDFTEHLEPLTRLLVDEYEIGVNRQTVLEELAHETGLALHTESGQDTSQARFIMPVIPLKTDIHKMAALLLL